MIKCPPHALMTMSGHGDYRIGLKGDIFLIALNPTRGSEIRKARPCVIFSPDELNAHLRTFIVAPLTTDGHHYPFRVLWRFDDKDSHVAADLLRAVD